MIRKFVLPAILTFATATVFLAAEKTAGVPPPTQKSDEAAKRHPLRGVVTGVYTEKSALLIKHDAIPGVMRAMTMLFRVDAATLKAARNGQTITGMLSREGDEWWLHDAKLSDAPAK